MSKFLLTFLFCLNIFSPAYADEKADFAGNQAIIEKLTGVKGKYDPKEKVFKISSPRKDLDVNIRGVKVIPEMGLTSWAAFTSMDSNVMVMGDLVLTENQVNPVMSLILDEGLNVTALHNHFFWETPRIMFMHIDGVGPVEKISKSVGKVFSMINSAKDMASTVPTAKINPANSSLNTAKIDSILGTKGTMQNGVYKIVIGRTAQMDGHTIGNNMGVNTWAAFAGTDKQAVVDGDIAMHESELRNVLSALRKADINVVAIHQHMIEEKPRFIFLHYYGINSVEKLAEGLRHAFDATK